MYIPDAALLKKYADVLIKFALWSGNGVKKGETVCLQVPESARPILASLMESTLEAGANPLVMLLPEGFDRWESVPRVFYEKGSPEQISYMPKEYLLARIQNSDHYVCMLAHAKPKELEGIDSSLLMARQKTVKFYKDARFAKEEAGLLTWVLALYGTEPMAQEAKMSLEEYWQQIISACYLDETDPVARWKETFRINAEYQKKLTDLAIDSVHVTAEGIDLTVKIGKDRKKIKQVTQDMHFF
jgi:aminopeptidase